MASNNTSFAMMLCGYNIALSRNCHAMPISLSDEVGRCRSFVPPIFIMAHGISVPISRERPPGAFVQA